MFVTFLLARFRAWIRYRDTVQELSRLSDRELADVGICRDEIHSVARSGTMAAA